MVLLDAATTTGLSLLIARHPWGLDLPISEGGRGLSGGQRTLTGLTRLLLSDPGLWLLDEPTSNLDAGTEKTVLAAIQAKMRDDSTFVMVTHKMSLLKLVDRSEEHTSELQSLMRISYAVFCLKKKN